MEDLTWLKGKLRNLLIEIESFMNESSLEYVEGSAAIVESGAYKWIPLSADQSEIQKELCEQYTNILNWVTHLKLESEIWSVFNQSGLRVLSFLRQDSMV